MDFVKMHGIGNDFICLDRFFFPQEEDYAVMAQWLCHRRTGVGADGLLIILPSQAADVRMRIFNQDGSEAEMCGNGLRCLARFVYDAGYVGQKAFRVETEAGIKDVSLESAGAPDNGLAPLVCIDMGEPSWQTSDIPVQSLGPTAVKETVNVGITEGQRIGQESTYTFTAVSMGNPHCVVFCEDIHTYSVKSSGGALEKASIFPNRTNVEFVTVHNRAEISIRVWERGVGETMACGTGACAAVVAAVLEGRTERSVLVHLPGGDLQVDWHEDNHVFMTGSASYVFRGELLSSDADQERP